MKTLHLCTERPHQHTGASRATRPTLSPRRAWRQALAVLAFGASTTGAIAQAWYQMDTPERVQAGLQANAARVYRLQPAAKVRPLPAAEVSAAQQKWVEDGQAIGRNALGAVLVENGALVLEAYGQGAKADTLHNAYSVTKSWTALAVGEALCAGKIKSLDDPAQQYAPQLQGTAYGQASVRNLLGYTSGAEDPFGTGFTGIHNRGAFNDMVEHRSSLDDLVKRYGGAGRFKAGEKFIYNGLDSESLSLVIRGATGQALPAWFEATVWQAAGAEHAAAWFLDRNGNGIAEILLFASTRDFARVGLYVLDRLTDQAGGDCIRQFIKEAAMPRIAKGYWPTMPQFGLGLHVGADSNIWMSGAMGQRIGINLAKRRVFVVNDNKTINSTDSNARAMLER